MKATTEKSGVLKLVHPGRFVEVHYKPITAAQVMKKNPRHCVTRPDVFTFPWIVVRPDSVLKLGSVFFIVPNHTIHRLLHASGSRRLPRRGLKQKSRVGDDRVGKQSVVEQWLELPPGVIESSFESWDDATSNQRDLGRIKQPPQVSSGDEVAPKLVHHDRRPKQLPSIRSSGKLAGKKPAVKSQCISSSCFSIPPLLQDRNCLPKRSPPIKRWKSETPKLKIRDGRIWKDSPATSVEVSTQSTSGSLVKVIASSPKTRNGLLKESSPIKRCKPETPNLKIRDGRIRKDSPATSVEVSTQSPSGSLVNVRAPSPSIGLALPPEQDLGLPKRRSSLRKPEYRGRLRPEGLKVRFLLPIEDENEW